MKRMLCITIAVLSMATSCSKSTTDPRDEGTTPPPTPPPAPTAATITLNGTSDLEAKVGEISKLASFKMKFSRKETIKEFGVWLHDTTGIYIDTASTKITDFTAVLEKPTVSETIFLEDWPIMQRAQPDLKVEGEYTVTIWGKPYKECMFTLTLDIAAVPVGSTNG